MNPDALFQICNTVTITGWVALLASPILPKHSDRVASLFIPLLLSVAYTGTVLAFWSGADGGFSSLRDVMKLFTKPEIVLAGWIHYLAFDLFVGAWEVRTARREQIPFQLVVPCLALTFMFGPAGFLVFSAIRAARAMSLTKAVA
jgi:Domain of unknown function (DUF4281)